MALLQILHFGTMDLNLAIQSTLQGYLDTFLSKFKDKQGFRSWPGLFFQLSYLGAYGGLQERSV